jgi:hypothetical protein
MIKLLKVDTKMHIVLTLRYLLKYIALSKETVEF